MSEQPIHSEEYLEFKESLQELERKIIESYRIAELATQKLKDLMDKHGIL